MSVGVIGLYFKVKISLVQFISDGTAKTKLAILAFLSCGKFVKTSYISGTVNEENQYSLIEHVLTLILHGQVCT